MLSEALISKIHYTLLANQKRDSKFTVLKALILSPTVCKLLYLYYRNRQSLLHTIDVTLSGGHKRLKLQLLNGILANFEPLECRYEEADFQPLNYFTN